MSRHKLEKGRERRIWDGREREKGRESNKKNLIIHHLLTKVSPHERETHTHNLLPTALSLFKRKNNKVSLTTLPLPWSYSTSHNTSSRE